LQFVFSLGIGGELVSIHTVAPIKLNQWYHLTATFDGSEMKLYLDGKLQSTYTRPGTIADYGQPLIFGKYQHDAASNFNGALDEVRLSATVRSENWIKLTHANQAPGSKLLLSRILR
jgi:hypothetical protein